MDIGKKIKTRRTERDMTQDDLAGKLNVGRSTISNWEIGRNYPDLQMLVTISDVLELSLDELLRENDDIVKRISEDTCIRNKQSLKIKMLYAVIGLLMIFGIIVIYNSVKVQDIRSEDQIISVSREGDSFNVITDIPKYRSIGGYFINDTGDRDGIMEVALFSEIDLTMKNKEEITVSPDREAFGEVKIIKFTNCGEVLKTFKME